MFEKILAFIGIKIINWVAPQKVRIETFNLSSYGFVVNITIYWI